jgi:protein tyrosine kinase modulator
MAYEDEEQQSGPVIPDFLRDPLGIPARRWPWMLAGLVVGLIVTGYLAWAWEPVYRSWASITIDTSRIPEELIRSTVEESDWGAVNALKLEVLTRDALNAWIEQFDLYPELRGDGRDPGEAIYALRSAIMVQQGGGFGGKRVAPSSQRSFNISVEYEDPKKAAQVTNAIADEFVKAGLHDRTQQAAVTADFLRRQLESSEKKLRAQETKIKEYIEAHRGELPEELNGNLRKLDQLQAQRQGLELRIAQTEQQLNALLSGETDPNSPQARLLSLRLELQHDLAIYTEEHPQVASLRRQIANIEAEIAGKGGIVPEGMTPQAMIAAQRRQLDLLHQQLGEVQTEAAEVDRRVANTPTRQDELNVLNREAGVLREEYMSFLRKVQEAELSRTVEAAQYAERIAVTDRANPPGVPEQPRWKLIVFGLAGALGAAVALGLGTEPLDPVIVAPDQLEHLTAAPVLGTMYRIA